MTGVQTCALPIWSFTEEVGRGAVRRARARGISKHGAKAADGLLNRARPVAGQHLPRLGRPAPLCPWVPGGGRSPRSPFPNEERQQSLGPSGTFRDSGTCFRDGSASLTFRVYFLLQGFLNFVFGHEGFAVVCFKTAATCLHNFKVPLLPLPSPLHLFLKPDRKSTRLNSSH